MYTCTLIQFESLKGMTIYSSFFPLFLVGGGGLCLFLFLFLLKYDCYIGMYIISRLQSFHGTSGPYNFFVGGGGGLEGFIFVLFFFNSVAKFHRKKYLHLKYAKQEIIWPWSFQQELLILLEFIHFGFSSWKKIYLVLNLYWFVWQQIFWLRDKTYLHP